ncbi:hypothetical protein M2284_004774 [Rhodococcus sp. LBL1]|nr:hypothetical protein [Rhodococcus sp. LBL1]MDH6686134.1 hypothetical protein [Rhodococcus sp. LBL2]
MPNSTENGRNRQTYLPGSGSPVLAPVHAPDRARRPGGHWRGDSRRRGRYCSVGWCCRHRLEARHESDAEACGSLSKEKSAPSLPSGAEDPIGTLAGMGELLVLIAMIGPLVLFGWAAIRAKRRGLGGSFVGPFQEMFDPGAARAHIVIEEIAGLPDPSDSGDPDNDDDVPYTVSDRFSTVCRLDEPRPVRHVYDDGGERFSSPTQRIFVGQVLDEVGPVVDDVGLPHGEHRRSSRGGRCRGEPVPEDRDEARPGR